MIARHDNIIVVYPLHRIQSVSDPEGAIFVDLYIYRKT